MQPAVTSTEPPGRGRGRPPTGRVRTFWTMPPDIRAAVEARARSDQTTESALVEKILRTSSMLDVPKEAMLL